MRRLLVLGVVTALATALLTSAASAAPPAMVDVCHFNSLGEWQVNTMRDKGKGVPAHLAHGDALPGEAVPGMAGYTFDNDCVPVADAPPGMVLDDFNDEPFVLNGPSASSSVAATVPGGTRYMIINDNGPSVTATVMSQVASNDYLDISVGEPSGTYTISYGGPSSEASNHLNLDLTTNGADRLQLISSQAGAIGTVLVVLASGCTGTVISTQCVVGGLIVHATGPGTSEFVFTAFSGPGVDFTDIDHIEIVHAFFPDNQNIRLEEFRTSGP